MVETSIVIRAFNEADYIGDVLNAIKEQEYKNFEIILVDSGSTDGTLEIAEDYVDKIEFVAPENFTFGYSCNVGCEAASGDFVAFLSAHAIPTDDMWLETMIDNFCDENVAMTYSNQVGADTTNFSERRLFDELFPEKRQRQTPPNYWTNNASSVIRRDLWQEHQFDEYLTGHEDIEWAKHFMDQGYVVIYEPDACIYHIHDETQDQIFNRFEREAIADVEIGIKQPSDRWREYLAIPKDIIKDLIAALKKRELSHETLVDIVQFRYNQHLGTISGLLSEQDLEADRYEYYYGEANESVVIDVDGSASIELSPLPTIKPNEVLIRTEYVRVDSEIDLPPDVDNYPIVPSGHYVGTVVDLGANANSIEKGDTVIGGTKFHCGVCSACNEKKYQNCANPTKLGVDTDYGSYSRFLSVPSDYVYPLPDRLDPREGTLLPLSILIRNELKRTNSLIDPDPDCIVVGETAKARLVVQIIESVEKYSATQITEKKAFNGPESPDFDQYDIIIEADGSVKSVRQSIQKANAGSVILLLGNQYSEFNLSNYHVLEKIIVKPEMDSELHVPDSVDWLADITLDSILNGTYDLSEFDRALNNTKKKEEFSLIRPNYET